MRSSRELGIRFQSDAEGEGSDFLLSSLEMVADFLEPNGERFFFDTSDGFEDEIGGRKCVDLFGWIVPDDKSDEFEREWVASEPGDAPGGFDYADITWRPGSDGMPKPIIKR